MCGLGGVDGGGAERRAGLVALDCFERGLSAAAEFDPSTLLRREGGGRGYQNLLVGLVG